MTLKILRLICHVVLILLDFIIYSIPTCILILVPNLFTTFFWYLPSIYQFYSFIFTEKEYDLRIRIYSFLFSPLIIILYIPFCIMMLIGFNIFITLINPIIIVLQRSEYPFHSISLTAALLNHVHQYFGERSFNELLIDSPILGTLKVSIDFMKSYWHFNSLKVTERIRFHESSISEFIISKLINLSDILTISLIFISIIIPFIIMIVMILIVIYLLYYPINMSVTEY